MKNIILFSLLFFCTTCTTYDSALIYHKDFVPGKNPLLQFNGFYSETSGDDVQFDAEPDCYVKPVFFYENGSAFATTSQLKKSTLANLVKSNRLVGSWGNYLIKGDTIQLEKFQLNESNYERVILKGVVALNKIHWTSRKEHNESFKPVDYTVYFNPFSEKPDSTKNFTRTKKKYNQ
jgi:hypothetical protein